MSGSLTKNKSITPNAIAHVAVMENWYLGSKLFVRLNNTANVNKSPTTNPKL